MKCITIMQMRFICMEIFSVWFKQNGTDRARIIGQTSWHAFDCYKCFEWKCFILIWISSNCDNICIILFALKRKIRDNILMAANQLAIALYEWPIPKIRLQTTEYLFSFPMCFSAPREYFVWLLQPLSLSRVHISWFFPRKKVKKN